MKKIVRFIIVVLTLVSFTAAFAEVGGTTRPGGGRSQTITISTDTLLGDDVTLLLPWQTF